MKTLKLMPTTPTTGNKPEQVINQDLEIESIDFFVRMMSMLGMPRSVGRFMAYSISHRPRSPWIKS